MEVMTLDLTSGFTGQSTSRVGAALPGPYVQATGAPLVDVALLADVEVVESRSREDFQYSILKSESPEDSSYSILGRESSKTPTYSILGPGVVEDSHTRFEDPEAHRPLFTRLLLRQEAQTSFATSHLPVIPCRS